MKNKEEKPFVYDKPSVKTQIFEVSLPGEKGRIIVTKKEVIRQLHNMGCTDGLPEDYVDSQISYKCYKEIDMLTEQKAIKAIKEMELFEKSKQGK